MSANSAPEFEQAFESIKAARADALARIAAAARQSGRAPETIALVAISKQQPDQRIDSMLATGQRLFGENRVQEAQARWTDRRAASPDLKLRLVGPLQSNKAQVAVEFFDSIDTLDRPKLAASLADAAQKLGRCPEILVQINTGEEPQKAGVSPAEADAFIARARGEFALPVTGLMCIPPLEEEPAMHFALLAKIAARNGLTELSMGMSDDFETAIRFGASQVRLGSALFGARQMGVNSGTET
jgi:pyridoxal phosphate enzyme (YggS family)